MAYPSPHAPAVAAAPATPGGARSMAKLLPDILALPLLMLFGFLLCYLLPFHAPAPHGVKVAVAGPISVTQIGSGLDRQVEGAFDVTPAADPAQARQQVLNQSAQAAYVVVGNQATLYTAKADGNQLEAAVTKAFTPVAGAEGVTLHPVELVGTVPGDPNAISLFYLALAWSIAPYLLVVSMEALKVRLSRRAKLGFIVGMGAFSAIWGFLIAFWLGAVPGQALPMLYGFLNYEAVALTVFGLAPLVGTYLVPAALLLFVFLSIPSSGGPVPYQMVPTFYSWLHPVLPLGNLIDAMRGIFYFDGTNMIRPTLVLCVWIAIGASLIAVPGLLPRARRHRAAVAPAVAAVPAVAPVSPVAVGPAAVAVPTPPSDPAWLAVDDHRYRAPILSGTVLAADSGPMPAATITVIDASGRQLVRTSTDPAGRYAVDGLPAGPLTVLLSVPGRMPIATRIVLAGEQPVKRDFVLAHPAEGVPTAGTAAA